MFIIYFRIRINLQFISVLKYISYFYSNKVILIFINISYHFSTFKGNFVSEFQEIQLKIVTHLNTNVMFKVLFIKLFLILKMMNIEIYYFNKRVSTFKFHYKIRHKLSFMKMCC